MNASENCMKIAMAILNYDRLVVSCAMACRFSQLGLPTRVITSPAPHDPPPDRLRREFAEIVIDERPGMSDFYGGKFLRGTRAMLAEGFEVLGWMTCDCEVPDPTVFVERVRRAFKRLPRLGVYMPECWWTYWLYEKEEAPVVDQELELYETPMLDSTCWFSRREVAAVLADGSMRLNRTSAGALTVRPRGSAHSLGYRWGRDYGILLRHEKATATPRVMQGSPSGPIWRHSAWKRWLGWIRNRSWASGTLTPCTDCGNRRSYGTSGESLQLSDGVGTTRHLPTPMVGLSMTIGSPMLSG